MDESEREEKVMLRLQESRASFSELKAAGCCSDDESGRKLDRCLQRMRNAGRIRFMTGKWEESA